MLFCIFGAMTYRLYVIDRAYKKAIENKEKSMIDYGNEYLKSLSDPKEYRQAWYKAAEITSELSRLDNAKPKPYQLFGEDFFLTEREKYNLENCVFKINGLNAMLDCARTYTACHKKDMRKRNPYNNC